jgi:hypothetical protein
MGPSRPKDDDLSDPSISRNENEPIPDEWPTQPELKIPITIDREKAARISRRIYEDVDRGLISALIDASPAEQSISLNITIKPLSNAPDKTFRRALGLLLRDIKKIKDINVIS